MIKYATTIILGITLFLGELHTFWEHPEEYRNGVLYQKIDGEWQVAKKVNWIITKDEPMTMQWNVKMVCDEIIVVLYIIAAFFFGKYPNRFNKATIIIFIQVAAIDVGLYFWDFKTENYHLVYFCIAITYFITFRKDIKHRLIG